MICRNCKISFDSKFCPNCGSPASDQNPGNQKLNIEQQPIPPITPKAPNLPIKNKPTDKKKQQ